MIFKLNRKSSFALLCKNVNSVLNNSLFANKFAIISFCGRVMCSEEP